MSKAQFVAHFGSINRVITAYEWTYSSENTTTFLRLTNVQNPTRAVQSGFRVSIQHRNEEEFQQTLRFFARHQSDAISLPSYDPMVRILYPARNIDFSGFVLRLAHSHKRFDYAPRMQVEFSLARDNINTLGTGSTGAPSWNTVVYGSGGGVHGDNPEWQLPQSTIGAGIWSPN